MTPAYAPARPTAHPARNRSTVAATHQASSPSRASANGNIATHGATARGSGLPSTTLSTITFIGHGESIRIALPASMVAVTAASATLRRSGYRSIHRQTRQGPIGIWLDSLLIPNRSTFPHQCPTRPDRLPRAKRRVAAAQLEELVVRPLLGDATLVQNDDAVGTADRA